MSSIMQGTRGGMDFVAPCESVNTNTRIQTIPLSLKLKEEKA